MAVKPSNGKPLKYQSAKALSTAIDAYFDDCRVDEKPYTFTGLALSLGFLSRQSIWEYSKRGDELSLPIKKAMLKIESKYEERLSGTTPAGAIFALKNRDWSDKQEVEHSGSVGLYGDLTDKELDDRIAALESKQ